MGSQISKKKKKKLGSREFGRLWRLPWEFQPWIEAGKSPDLGILGDDFPLVFALPTAPRVFLNPKKFQNENSQSSIPKNSRNSQVLWSWPGDLGAGISTWGEKRKWKIQIFGNGIKKPLIPGMNSRGKNAGIGVEKIPREFWEILGKKWDFGKKNEGILWEFGGNFKVFFFPSPAGIKNSPKSLEVSRVWFFLSPKIPEVFSPLLFLGNSNWEKLPGFFSGIQHSQISGRTQLENPPKMGLKQGIQPGKTWKKPGKSWKREWRAEGKAGISSQTSGSGLNPGFIPKFIPGFGNP